MKYYDGAIAKSSPSKTTVVTSRNSPPSSGNWGASDDTLDRQGGHGICKGLATAWVIALVNGVAEARTPELFRRYFIDVLRFQGTYIKDYGKHIDGHVAQLSKMGSDPNVRFIRKVDLQTIRSGDLPAGNWGAYISIWKHDIAIGSYNGDFYIMDPNCGLLGYNRWTFLQGVQSLIEGRRARKNKGPMDTIGVWFYR
ncbi:MAG: hypothetical protein ACI9U2_000609 [Bradymonadia bacterium]|jgi:hypothetical protein